MSSSTTDDVGALVSRLCPREREVLALIAAGLTNRGVARRLYLSVKTVECNLRHIFWKLELPDSPYDNRRVLAARLWLAATDADEPA
jgi:DNA-binding NarL/FixJ family response regulator